MHRQEKVCQATRAYIDMCELAQDGLEGLQIALEQGEARSDARSSSILLELLYASQVLSCLCCNCRQGPIERR